MCVTISAKAEIPLVFCSTHTTRSWVRPEAIAGAAQSAQTLPSAGQPDVSLSPAVYWS